ncbi:MAG: ATP-grasp domain-containing protein [Sphaerochaetaceae bacterium]|nr:ATP-grasp domain-containing protein [Sphaerochaetaceae bacterium]
MSNMYKKQKTLMLLGGSRQQVLPIIKAKELKYKTVLCDYLPNNPGREFADVFYLISTTDKDEILKVAKKEKIDGIVAYASDPAAATVGYVSEKLNLPGGHPYQSVEILTNKDKFREFLRKNGFNVPKAKSFSSFESFLKGLEDFNFPVIIKPVDSSGSKGISYLENKNETLNKHKLLELFTNALQFSRNKKIIVEDLIKKKGYQVAGDGFSIDGKLVFRCFGDDHFDVNNSNPFVPIAASFPTSLSESMQSKIHDEIQRLLSLLNMGTGAYNFDIIIDDYDNIFLMEIGPRNGGNYIPQVIEYSCGVDLLTTTLQFALNEGYFKSKVQESKFCCYYAIHSKVAGTLKNLTINSDFKKNNLIQSFINIEIGQYVEAYNGSNSCIGILLLHFDNWKSMIEAIESPFLWMNIEVS